MAVTLRDRAIVLKVMPIRDADRRYVVYTKRHGKMGLFGAGTRRGKSKMSPHMGGFGSVDIMVARGKRFDRLAGASLHRWYSGIGESLPGASLAQGFLLAVDRLTRWEQPDERIFSLIERFLSVVGQSPPSGSADGRGPIFDAGIIRLLDLLGVGPELDRCVRCRGNLGGREPAMNFLRGGLECLDCRHRDSLPLMESTVERLRRFRTLELSESAVLPPPHHMTGRVIEALLANHLEDRFPALHFMRKVAA